MSMKTKRQAFEPDLLKHLSYADSFTRLLMTLRRRTDLILRLSEPILPRYTGRRSRTSLSCRR